MMTEQKDFIMPTTIVNDEYDEDDLSYDESIMQESVMRRRVRDRNEKT